MTRRTAARPLIVLLSLVSVQVSAQQLQVSRVEQPSERQPVVLSSIDPAGDLGRPAEGWSLTPGGAPDIELPGLRAQGVGVRITGGTATTVYRPEWNLAGIFSVSATFETSDQTASFGLTVGGAQGAALVVRGNGGFAVSSLGGGRPMGGGWAPVALRGAPADAPLTTRLEIRVASTEATFVIDGQVVRTQAITPGRLDGVPGVHIGASSDVTVSGFTVQTTELTRMVEKQ